MNAKRNGRVDVAADVEKSKSQFESSTISPQVKVLATGEFRRELLTMIRTLQHARGFEDAVHVKMRPEDLDTTFMFGVETTDKTAALGLEVTVHDWQPLSSIPAMTLDQDLLEILSYAESVLHSVRLTVRGGRAALASAHPDEFVGELRDMCKLADQISDRVGNPASWAPVPDDAVVSVSWWPMLPTGVIQ